MSPIAVVISTLNRVFESIEQSFDDEIFRVQGYDDRGLLDSSAAASEIHGRHDFTRHIVSNMGKNVYSIDRTNIALPIREYSPISKFAGTRLFQDDMDKSHGLGVFIIDRYSVYDVIGVDITGLTDYYKHNTTLPKDSIVRIKSELQHCTKTNSTVIRVVYYVPKHELDKNRHVLVPDCGLVITKGVPKEILHPDSMKLKMNKDITKAVEEEGNNLLSINIVNNNNPYKCYYMVVGGSVERLLSHPSQTMSDGVTFVRKKDGVLIEGKNNYTLEELSSLGIYESEDMAIYNGDKKLMLEEADQLLNTRRLEIEDSKVKLSNKKLEIEDVKLEITDKQLDHEVSKRDHDAKMERIKLEHLKESNRHELELKKLAYQNMLAKHHMEITTAIINHRLDTSMMVGKFKLDTAMATNKYRNDMNISRSKFENDMELSRLKQRSEESKFLVGVLSSVVSVGKVMNSVL